MRDIAIVGGGYAGMAAAVALSDQGARATVYEAAKQLGGRARGVAHRGLMLDNGLHILIGAYQSTLRLIERVGNPGRDLLRTALDLQVHRHFRLRAAPLPAPWHLAMGLLRARGIDLAAKIACARMLSAWRRRDFRLADDMTVESFLRDQRQDPHAIRYLWEPLCLAALNTPIAQASAQVFLNVLRDSLAAGRQASELILPRTDLSALFPLPAAEYVRQRGGEVRPSERVTAIRKDQQGYEVVTPRGRQRHAAVIVATAPQHVPALIADLPELTATIRMIEALRYQPIVSVYLQYGAAVRLPAPLLGLSDGHAQWLLDRGALCGQSGLIAAVISAHGEHGRQPRASLSQQVQAQLARAFSDLTDPLWVQVIEEKRATFACTPALARPDQRTPLPGLFLAGDYTRGDYPATLEAAVRSGLRCAELALGATRRGAGGPV